MTRWNPRHPERTDTPPQKGKTMLILTATALTDSARAKAKETTGDDPGAHVYRLHRDTCSRIKPKDAPVPVDEAPAASVWTAKACTGCSPAKAEVQRVKFEARKHMKEADEIPVDEHLAGARQGVKKAEPTRRPGGPRKTAEKAAQAPAAPKEPVQVTDDVFAGPAVTLDRQGAVKPIRPAAYPEVVNHPLRCAGCDEVKPASNFQFVDKKGSGRGRFVECTRCQTDRLAWNKAHPDMKRPSPKFPADVVAKQEAKVDA